MDKIDKAIVTQDTFLQLLSRICPKSLISWLGKYNFYGGKNGTFIHETMQEFPEIEMSFSVSNKMTYMIRH